MFSLKRRFRKRIGEDGVSKIFASSVKLHGKEVPSQAKFVLSDTTVQATYNGKHPGRVKQAKKGKKRLSTIANARLRELDRKMGEEQKAFYRKKMEFYHRAVNQQKSDTNKVYSLHKPYTQCISKGKPHKQYEMRSIHEHLEK